MSNMSAPNITSSPGAVAASAAQTQEMNLGAILVGCIVQAVFYGNTLSLAWRYHTVGRRGDPWWFRVSIGVACLLCTFSVAVTVHGLWFFTVDSLFRQGQHAPWTVDFFLFINSVVATLVRVLYVYRLAKLCKTLSYFRGRILSTLLLALTVLLCLVEVVASIVISIRLYTTDAATTGKDRPFLKPMFYLIFAVGWTADAILTGLMCLWLHSARTGLHRTDSAINNMIMYTLQTGLFPSIVETGGMIAFIVVPDTQIFIAFYLQIGLLYLSSLLTSLNTRRLVQQRIRQPISLNFSILDDADAPTTDRGSSLADATQPGPLAAQSAVAPAEDAEEKAMTPDVERPQEELERDALALAQGQVGALAADSSVASVRPRRAVTLPAAPRRADRRRWLDIRSR